MLIWLGVADVPWYTVELFRTQQLVHTIDRSQCYSSVVLPETSSPHSSIHCLIICWPDNPIPQSSQSLEHFIQNIEEELQDVWPFDTQYHRIAIEQVYNCRKLLVEM